jgi:uncharacterized YigZ family protein
MSRALTYQTIKRKAKGHLFKDRGSKFIGDAFPIKNKEEVRQRLIEVKEDHPKANHHCYAYSLGHDEPYIRYNDDGEPTNSAGKPIYGQIYGFDITNVLVVVTRYFGGTKLGVGGLIHAYKTTAKLCLEETKIVQKEITDQLEVKCNYEQMNEVLKLVKREELSIVHQELELKCTYILEVNVEGSSSIKERLEMLKGVAVRLL